MKNIRNQNIYNFAKYSICNLNREGNLGGHIKRVLKPVHIKNDHYKENIIRVYQHMIIMFIIAYNVYYKLAANNNIGNCKNDIVLL